MRVVASGGLLLLAGTWYLISAVDWRHAVLLLVGGFAGMTLYHASFGFTSAWRILINDRRSAGVRAQMVMLGLACAVFVPILAAGSPVFGQVPRGSLAPVGMSVVVGAFLFGIGMQLGGGCASGTLYSAGGGSTRTLVTLAFFIAGSVIGTAHAPFWDAAPSLGSVSLLASFGAGGALAISLTTMAVVYAAVRRIERERHGRLEPITAGTSNRRWWLTGPWPLIWGAVGLALVNITTLLVAGRPWGVTSAFALWGAKVSQAIGIDVASWEYWAVSSRAASLAAPVASDITSVMNVGIVLGAFAAAGLAGRFAPVWRVPLPSLAAAVIGGLLLGYGARVAYGCNIGAFFSGVASTSLHGWLWLAAAFAGNVVGARIRPVFGLGR